MSWCCFWDDGKGLLKFNKFTRSLFFLIRYLLQLTPARGQPSPDHNVMIPGASTDVEKDKEKEKDKQTTEPEKVKKRTGKPRAAADRLKFTDYFERWLAEEGITFRTWLQEHRKKNLWVCLGKNYRIYKLDII